MASLTSGPFKQPFTFRAIKQWIVSGSSSLAVVYLLLLAQHLLGDSLELVIAAATSVGKVDTGQPGLSLSLPS